MRSTAVRRTAPTAAAASLVLLVSACGGEGSGGGTKDDTKGKESAAAEPAAEALTAAELERLVLAQGDVKAHKVEKAGPNDDLAAKDVTVDKAGCGPLAHAVAGVPLGEAVGTVKRRVTSEPRAPDPAKDLGEMTEKIEDAIAGAFDVTTTLTSLSSYDGKGGADAVAVLRTAGAACGGGFTMSMDGSDLKVTKLTELKVSGGKENTAWAVLAEQDGQSVSYNVAVVRRGGTLASFSAVDVAELLERKKSTLPTAVIDAQVAKLG
ncbi:hypothetical protein ACWGI0_27455 [Streptomyces sp. NPDC054802]